MCIRCCSAASRSSNWYTLTERGKRVIRRDVLARQYGLNERQLCAIGHLLENGRMTGQDFETLCPSVHRRTLQRDLKDLVVKGIVLSEGATNRLVYVLKDC